MRIMIIGGTSGIGLALAEHYAGQGAQLALCARRVGRLHGHLLAGAANVRTYEFDIADREGLVGAIQDFGADGLDLLIVTAGQYADAAELQQRPASGHGVVRTNVVGLVQAFDVAAEVMLRQGTGQLVAVASIAGLLKDYPGGSLYSASKRAAIGVCDAYRKSLAPFGIAVTTLVPGYVDTARLRGAQWGRRQRQAFPAVRGAGGAAHGCGDRSARGALCLPVAAASAGAAVQLSSAFAAWLAQEVSGAYLSTLMVFCFSV